MKFFRNLLIILICILAFNVVLIFAINSTNNPYLEDGQEYTYTDEDIVCQYIVCNQIKEDFGYIEELFNNTNYKPVSHIYYGIFTNLVKGPDGLAGIATKLENGMGIIAFNKETGVDEGLVAHELCHVILKQNGYTSATHDSKEWNELCDYFWSLGMDVYRDGYRDLTKVKNLKYY